ncbi:MAG: hypothetical protein R2882_05965 [Gemmatimonadales bacterium]
MRRHVGPARSAAVAFAALAAGFSPAALAAQSACAAARDDARVTAIADFLDRIAATAPVWDDFSPANEPVILAIDTMSFRGGAATPACTLVWRARAGLELVELTRLPPLSTPLYGFADLTRPGPRADATADGSMRRSRQLPAEDQERLRAAGVARAAVLPVPLDLSRLGQFGEMLKRAKVDPGLIQAELAVHEGFHLHVQFPAWLDQERRYAWPAWDVQPDRNAMRTACYAGSPEISAAFAREVDALSRGLRCLFGASPRHRRGSRGVTRYRPPERPVWPPRLRPRAAGRSPNPGVRSPKRTRNSRRHRPVDQTCDPGRGGHPAEGQAPRLLRCAAARCVLSHRAAAALDSRRVVRPRRGARLTAALARAGGRRQALFAEFSARLHAAATW